MICLLIRIHPQVVEFIRMSDDIIELEVLDAPKTDGRKVRACGCVAADVKAYSLLNIQFECC